MWEKIKSLLNLSIISFKEYEITMTDILLILLGYIIVRFIMTVMRSRLTRQVFVRNNIDLKRQSSLMQILQYIIYTIFIFFSLEIVGVDLSIVLAGSAALLVGLGFGIQQIFNDLVSGIILLFERNVAIGDVLEFDNLVGRVDSVGLRTSKIQTREGMVIVVPNSKFIVDNVINWTHLNQSVRFNVSVGVAYGSDVTLVKKILLKCAEEHPKTVKKPAPFVRFIDFGNSSLDFQIYFWSIETWSIEDTKSDLRFAIDREFRANKVTIPFPQRDLHFKSSELPNWPAEK